MFPMSPSENRIDDPAEIPVDPATERVRRKMVRLLAVSIGVMLIGVMAVLAAVVYRVNEPRAGTVPQGASVPFVLPAGTEILESNLSGDSILLRVEGPDGAGEILVMDRASGAVSSRHPIAFR